MGKELNTNNSKKLIIGVSILFCAVILIIGATTAYFTQSDSESTGNIVATDKVTLDYQDNDAYMLGDLIPINEKDLETAYNKTENKCKDNLGYNVCSIYQFTITNTGNVVQDIIIDLYPKVNGFTNLKFNLYDITNNEQIIFNQELILNSEEPINLENDLRLDTSNNKSNTYELVFYIKNDPYNDQTDLDAGKRFGANIKVNSVTTGTYILEELGDPGCWKADDNDPTIISEFIGYTDKNGNEKFDENDELKTECANYFKKDEDNYYIVNVPSEYVGYNFTRVGNNLLTGYDLDENGEPTTPNEYSKIKSLTLNDNITTIGEVGDEAFSLSFAGLGVGIEDEEIILEVKLPNKLITIGSYTFFAAGLKNITIPKNVQIIGMHAFYGNEKLTLLTFEEGSQLKEIGIYAFGYCNITTNETNPLIIPESVTTIGNNAFNQNHNLTKITFAGSLTIVTEDNKLTIGEMAFDSCKLNYQDASKPLELPARIVNIGIQAFIPGDITYSQFKYVRYHGTKDNLNKFNSAIAAKYVRIAEEYDVNEAETIGNN